MIDYRTYVGINDYTCDIDYPGEIDQIRNRIPAPLSEKMQ